MKSVKAWPIIFLTTLSATSVQPALGADTQPGATPSATNDPCALTFGTATLQHALTELNARSQLEHTLSFLHAHVADRDAVTQLQKDFKHLILQYGAAHIPDEAGAVTMRGLRKITPPASGDLRETAAQYATLALGLKGKVTAVDPPTIATSAARVLIIVNDGKPVAAFKLFFDGPGSLIREMGSMQTLADAHLTQVHPVAALDAAKVDIGGTEHPALLEAYAHGSDLEQLIRQASANDSLEVLKRAVDATGAAIAEIHARFQARHPNLAQIKEVGAYEAKRLLELSKAGGTLDQLEKAGWLSAEELALAKNSIRAIDDAYLVQLDPSASRATITHGDAHQGNFFYDPKTGKIQTIDVQTLAWSIQPGSSAELPQGSVDPLADVGRFYAALEVNGLWHNLSFEDIHELQESFLDSYSKARGLPKESLRQPLEFHRLRFIGAVLADIQGKKVPEATRRLLLDRTLKSLGIRTSSEGGQYAKQDRGDATAYASYFAGMDTTMRQKVALTGANFPTSGKIADMGSGSGTGSSDFAGLYPRLDVVGVDINPKSVEIASQKYQRPNLSYKVGDVTENLFGNNALDGILNSSVGHHLTSFNDFDVAQVQKAFANHAAQLKDGGVLVYRDFVIPEGPQETYMDLPANDGPAGADITRASSAAAFEDFAAKFRSSIHRQGGVPFAKMDSPYSGFVRYKLDYRSAVEFILRKNYRRTQENWESELLEEYTYMTQKEFEQSFEKNGFRIITSKPIYNPWIVENRFKGKLHISTLEGEPLPFPPTNYFIVGEKVNAHRSVSLKETASVPVDRPRFLKMGHYRNKETGHIYDLVSRPHDTVDLIPWFEDENGNIYISHRKDYPRPIVNARDVDPPLNGGTTSGYISEPISAVIDPHRDLVSNALSLLSSRANIHPEQVLEIGNGAKFLTSPGGVDEEVHSVAVRIKPPKTLASIPRASSGFSESGSIHSMDATQALRSYQAGGMFDSRLEVGIYKLLLDHQKGVGPWIGAELKLTDQHIDVSNVQEASAVLNTPKSSKFEEVAESANYLEARRGTFAETDHAGKVITELDLEYVVPKGSSRNTATAIPVVKSEGRIYVGLEIRDLPAAQQHHGSSTLVVNPSWRLPKGTQNLDQAEAFVKSRLRTDYQTSAARVIPLGGEYYPSAGTTPEIVFPYAVEVNATDLRQSTLHWVPLEELILGRQQVVDGHLLTSMYRLAHAVGLLKP